MASNVPKFGAWEGGENFTVFFDNARRMKMNGAMINPNDPEEYANMFPHKNGASVQPSPSCISTESQGNKQSKVPQFGAWDHGGNVGYSVCFDNARKTNNVAPQNSENSTNPEPQEARVKVPSFGAWEDGQDLSYTVCFDKIKKTNYGPTDLVPPEPPVRRDVGERARRGSGASTNGRSNNEHVGDMRNTSQRSVGSSMAGSITRQRYGRPAPGGRAILHSRGTSQSKLSDRGSHYPEKGASIPPFGVWHNDPSRVEDYTCTFRRAVEERKTPLNKNYQQTQGYKQERKKRSCFSCFGI